MREKCKGCDMAEEALAICETCDEIDALRAEKEVLETNRDVSAQEYRDLQAQNKKLREALEEIKKGKYSTEGHAGWYIAEQTLRENK